jgi:hypothetical protein
MRAAIALSVFLAALPAFAQEAVQPTANDMQAAANEANEEGSGIAHILSGRAQNLAANLNHANAETASAKAEVAAAKEHVEHLITELGVEKVETMRLRAQNGS